MKVTNKGASKRKKRGAIIAAAAVLVLIVMWAAFILCADRIDPMPLPILLLMLIPAAAVIIGVLIALLERMKEIEKGEEDEACKY